MKKIVFVVIGCLFFSMAFSQESWSSTTSNNKVNFTNRSGDHFMLQLSSDHLSGMPDSISSHQKGLSRGFNAYVMLNKPFKGAPKLSLGIGVGISTSNIYFKKMEVDVKAAPGLLPFIAEDSANHFKKYKLALSYLQVPLEFRYTSNPNNPNKSFKAALGVKVGTLVNVHNKGKNLQNASGTTLNGYLVKENSKRFFNSTDFMATARFGYGIVSLFGSYQLNRLLKDGAGPNLKLYQVGITLSGL
ncbi:MAG TPA: outer membrane beta-barrel protein [Hanamia sp.]|nr:outer membrane beta-barrel protein [Hanamia sp.]